MNHQNALLIIDAQYDFCNPEGSLFVIGADADMERLAAWISSNKEKIGHIVLTQDSHPVNDISHPSFWEDTNGNFPQPFTPITYEDIKEGKWMPRFYREEAVKYVETLEKQGEFGHFIWPYHCITGSVGFAIDTKLMQAVIDWSLKGKDFQVVVKGTNPLTEHFGIFRANIPMDGFPETQLNKSLLNTLNTYERIFLGGEAKSHCVANSLKQVMDEAPELAAKFVILEDCMSDVTGLGHLGEPIYAQAKDLGIAFARTTDIVL